MDSMSAYFDYAWKGFLACAFDDCDLFIYHYLYETQSLSKPPKAAFL